MKNYKTAKEIEQLGISFWKSRDSIDFGNYYNATFDYYLNIGKKKYNTHISLLEDSLCDFYMNIFENINQYNSRWRFNTWAGTIFHNVVKQKLRNKAWRNQREIKNLEIVESRIIEENIEDKIEKEQNIKLLREYIEKLEEPYKTVIKDKYYKEYTLKEMAEKYNVDIQIIKNNLLRARYFLRIMMGLETPEKKIRETSYNNVLLNKLN